VPVARQLWESEALRVRLFMRPAMSEGVGGTTIMTELGLGACEGFLAVASALFSALVRLEDQGVGAAAF
jgi:hypothetical protein